MQINFQSIPAELLNQLRKHVSFAIDMANDATSSNDLEFISEKIRKVNKAFHEFETIVVSRCIKDVQKKEDFLAHAMQSIKEKVFEPIILSLEEYWNSLTYPQPPEDQFIEFDTGADLAAEIHAKPNMLTEIQHIGLELEKE